MCCNTCAIVVHSIRDFAPLELENVALLGRGQLSIGALVDMRRGKGRARELLLRLHMRRLALAIRQYDTILGS